MAFLNRQGRQPLDFTDPRLRAVWNGIRRALGAPPNAKKALTPEHLRAIVTVLPPTLQGARDRALLLGGCAAALRRSEISGLDAAPEPNSLGWIVFAAEGLSITLARSKENPLGTGAREIAVPFGRHADTCPVRALQAWLTMAGIERGPLFRSIRRGDHLASGRLSGGDIARRVKAMVGMIGKPAGDFGGHSLRAGLVTAAARAGASDQEIMSHTRHRDLATMRRYIRAATLFEVTPARRVDL